MTNYTNCSSKEKRENLRHNAGQYSLKVPKIIAIFNDFIQQLVVAITKGDEPQVSQKFDKYGKNYWHGYDPANGRSVCQDSELEMRIWLERRYYQ